MQIESFNLQIKWSMDLLYTLDCSCYFQRSRNQNEIHKTKVCTSRKKYLSFFFERGKITSINNERSLMILWYFTATFIYPLTENFWYVREFFFIIVQQSVQHTCLLQCLRTFIGTLKKFIIMPSSILLDPLGICMDVAPSLIINPRYPRAKKRC